MAKFPSKLRRFFSRTSSTSSSRTLKGSQSSDEVQGENSLEIMPSNRAVSNLYSPEELIVYKDESIYCQGFLGAGAQGRVRKGRWNNMDVAVKYIFEGEGRRQLMKEINIFLQLDHENIIKLFHYSKVDYCLVMELAKGGNLHNFVEGKISYRIEHALSWALQIARGILHMHQMNPPIIHRDIKPGNILLHDFCRRVKICDFGLACNLRDYMTRERGTPLWMAPEVALRGKYSQKCDIFSWAVTFWQMLTRKSPGKGYLTGHVYFYDVAYHKHRPPLIQECPKFLEDLIVQCWAHHEDERPSSDQVVKIVEKIYETFVLQPPSPIYAISDELYADSNDAVIAKLDESYKPDKFDDLGLIMKLDKQNELFTEYAKLLIEEVVLNNCKRELEEGQRSGIFEDEVEKYKLAIRDEEETIVNKICELEAIQNLVDSFRMD